jgi:FKBP-type peptidyl-prolyl cis-trans isomerase FkpA
MRQKIFTLLIISAIGLLSCRKTKVEPDIKQYDQAQIEAYIGANGLSGMKRDKTNGDTTGIYYKIINPGDSVDLGKPLPPMDYPDKIALVFTARSFDGKYVLADTISNHFDDFLGHMTLANLPLPVGLQMAVRNNLRYRGGSMRVLIPSHLAYGVGGYGSGSINNTNTRIAGNQCLDYYVHVIGNTSTDNEATYDDRVIRNYMGANSLTGYTKTATGMYYKVLTPGTGTVAMTSTGTNTANYTGQLLNGNIFDQTYSSTSIFSFTLSDGLISGVVEGLQNYTRAGTKISLLIPSGLGYGDGTFGSIPPNSCLMFAWQILTITP